MNSLMNRLKSFLGKGEAANQQVMMLDGPTDFSNVDERFELFQQAYEFEHNGFESNDSAVGIQVAVNMLEIVGNYAVKGHNPGKAHEPYHGHLSLWHIGGKIKAKWEIGFSQQLLLGEGFVYGNKLVLHFYYHEDDAEYAGMVIYEIQEDGSLKGYWIEEGIFAPGFESCELKNRIV
ncbi:hypothetical protein V6R21_23220 [Limibacter armeniacum]|uniref:hypothetical protein n=1 Tax=Limibacter armeniacum TaxID=466084 RepID=UPI002FE6BB8A